MLNLGTLGDVLLNFDRVLVELCSEFTCHLDLLMCEGDVVLENMEHCLVAL